MGIQERIYILLKLLIGIFHVSFGKLHILIIKPGNVIGSLNPVYKTILRKAGTEVIRRLNLCYRLIKTSYHKKAYGNRRNHSYAEKYRFA